MDPSLLPSAIGKGVCPPDVDTPVLGVQIPIHPALLGLFNDRRTAVKAAVRYSPAVRRAVRHGWRFGQPVYHPESDWIFLPLRHACGELWRLRLRGSRGCAVATRPAPGRTSPAVGSA